jgi:hypothetical protein
MLDVKAILLVGGAVALPTLLEKGTSLGKTAGKANTAAAGVLGNVAGIAFAVPTSYSMVAAFDSMRAAIARASSPPKANQVRTLWLAAYTAGAKADVVNYNLVTVDTGNGIIDTMGSLDDLKACDVFSVDELSKLGAAVCALQDVSVSPFGYDAADLELVLAATARLAAAMDAADFTRDGARRSDGLHISSITELPGRIIGGLADAVLPSKMTIALVLGAVGVAGYVAWRMR